MNKKDTARLASLLPNGVPKMVRVYDNRGKTFDRFTVVYTGVYGHKTGGQTWVLGMSESPYNPQGFGQHNEYPNRIDRPTYSHLGKKIKFQDLPADCRHLVLTDYVDLWNLKGAVVPSREFLAMEDKIKEYKRLAHESGKRMYKLEEDIGQMKVKQDRLVVACRRGRRCLTNWMEIQDEEDARDYDVRALEAMDAALAPFGKDPSPSTPQEE
jgi:hypothetical protein